MVVRYMVTQLGKETSPLCFHSDVVKENPFLHQDIAFLDPSLSDGFDCIKPGLESSNFSIGFSMCGHLLCSSLGSCQNLQVVCTVLVKCKNLIVQSLDFSQI